MVEKNRIAVYVTANKNYFQYAIIALKSFMRFFKNLDYFILTDSESFSSDNEKVIKKIHGINLIYTDITEEMKQTHSENWPSIVYAMLAGPELFYKMGYFYSLGLDADVFCVKPFNILEVFDQTKTFSGIKNQDSIISNIQKIYRDSVLLKYGIDKNQVDELFNPNTGVLFWNNGWAANEDLFNKCRTVYNKHKDHLILSDQSILATVILIHCYSYNHLPHNYNFRIGNPNDGRLGMKSKDIIICHYLSVKPWEKYLPSYNKLIIQNIILNFRSIVLELKMRKLWRSFSEIG